jgi:NAD(P)-dependent dehydrogenase (short-subunit alcohol dehydrogenase family)
VAAELKTAGAKVAFRQADVGTEAACLDFVNGAAQKFGRLDILINNAGIRKYEKVDEASAASWKEILDVNLMGYVFCAKAVVPLMRRNKGGAIVNVASVRSVVAGGGNLQYDTTKAAVAGLTRALAADHSAGQQEPIQIAHSIASSSTSRSLTPMPIAPTVPLRFTLSNAR